MLSPIADEIKPPREMGQSGRRGVDASDHVEATMHRIMVVGNAGAGKSTFARRLGGKLGLRVIPLGGDRDADAFLATVEVR